ncbi:MAG: transcription antitermination factor NusB [Acidobacteriaceae bacterium]
MSATVSPARSAAFHILLWVATTSAHADDLLHDPAVTGLSPLDRNLATTLTLGVLRWQIALDARIGSLLRRPGQVLPIPVAIALRLGAFQLLYLDRIPAHAALSESVELVRAAHHPGATGMVNAILRNLTRQPAPKPRMYETAAACAQRLGHPLWIMDRWIQNYGRSAAVTICEHGQKEPVRGSLFAADLHERVAAVTPAAELTASDVHPAPAVAEVEVVTTPLVRSSASLPLAPLDDGSRLVAELSVAVAQSAASAEPVRVWDTCAAPGGKTLILLHRLAGAHLLATDSSPRRLHLLTDRLQAAVLPGREGLSGAWHVRTLHADAAQLPASEGLFDLILCDVPCSGTGTLGRNPEIRHRLEPTELPRQAARQRQILSSALARLAPGGNLIYSTCSLEPEENEQVVFAVLATTPGITNPSLEPVLERLSSSGILTSLPLKLIRNGFLRTVPGVNFQGDGFFAALLHRPS